MSDVAFVDNDYIRSIIDGLKNLYEELVLDGSEQEMIEGSSNVKWFEREQSKTLESLKELFINQQKDTIEQRQKMNSEVVLFKKFTRVFVIQNMFCFLDLNDIMKLTGVSLYFNSMIKSIFFIRYIVALRERTKISIDLSAFDS